MNDQYSALTALFYVFNVIVGTGALTLPQAFLKAGWLFSSILMAVLAFLSYVTVTFVVEAMSSCNAISQWTQLEKMKRVSRYLKEAIQADEQHSSNEDLLGTVNDDDDDNISHIVPTEYINTFPSEPNKLFTLDKRIEFGEMADLIFGRLGRTLFYGCIVSYLYGDLTIYSVSVAKSLADTTCSNGTNITTVCWENGSLSVWDVYRLYLSAFIVLVGPFVYFNIQKTKYLQYVTTCMRWTALLVMVGLGIAKIARNGAQSPAIASPSHLPALLGASVYSFMCHHSLPSMLSPVSDKSHLARLLAADYSLILTFYLGLALSAVFAFSNVEDLYTLNFEPKTGDSWPIETVGYFLALFPVFTLTATFPVMAVTLRNNIQAMFTWVESYWFQHVLIPTLTILPVFALAFTTQNIDLLVGITGSYAGVGIQYLIPAALVTVARCSIPAAISHLPNPYKSPFTSSLWPLIIVGWALLSIVLVTFNIVSSIVHS